MQEIEGIQTISLQPLPPTIIHHALLFRQSCSIILIHVVMARGPREINL